MANEDMIEWSPNYTLKLTDFKKEFDDKKSVIQGMEKRQCVSSVWYVPDYDKKIIRDGKKFVISEFGMKTVFDRNLSFYDSAGAEKDGISQEEIDYLILHEQGHFDLLEENRERFEREVSSRVKGKVFSISDSQNSFVELLNRVLSEIVYPGFQKIQDRYEELTYHGTNKPEQNKFNKRFKELRQLRRIKESKLPKQ